MLYTGFLSTGDSDALGNYALLDLTAALRWVQENIKAFGGSPTQVTLMGHGVGAVLVNLLTVSPIVSGLSLVHDHCIQLTCQILTCEKMVETYTLYLQ